MPSRMATSITSWRTSFPILFCVLRANMSENEETEGVLDDIISEQRRSDNSRVIWVRAT